MVLTALAGYAGGRLLGRFKNVKGRRATLIMSIAVCLLPLLLFKYGDFLIANVNSLFRSEISLLHLVLPIGVSFYTFQILSYVIDVYRREVKVERNPLYFLMYVSLFPQLIAGPIVRFSDIQHSIRNRNESIEMVASGITRFVVGLGKKVLIANTLAELGKHLTSMTNQSVLSLWLVAFAFTLQIYFDFSGYSDMAIGLGRMFGFSFLENFNYPYLSKSVTEFWRRWHMSLGSWFRDYLYIPMGGNRGKWISRLINLLIVWFLTGLWHGAAWNYIVWGLFYFTILLIERAGLLKLLERLPAAIRIFYTLVLVMLGFVLFNAHSLSHAIVNLKGMFGLSSLPFVDLLTLYYARSFAVTMAFSMIASTPLFKNTYQRLSQRSIGMKRATDVVTFVGIAMTMTLVTGWLVNGSFNPFLYFRF